MLGNISEFMRTRMLGEKVFALEDCIALLRGDVSALLENYMRLAGDVYIAADIDERSGDVVFTVQAKAKEIFDCGKILKA